MRWALPISLLAALSACTTPLQQCLDDANRDYRGLLAAIQIGEQNVARGYAIQRDTIQTSSTRFCVGAGTGYHSNLRGRFVTCSPNTLRTVETPVPINVDEERQKLASMKRLLPSSRARADAASAACYDRFPE